MISFKGLSIGLNPSNLGEMTLHDQIQQKIEETNQQLEALRQERDQLNNEAETWAEKRNQFNQRIKALQNEVKKLREKRDEINIQVQALKATREKAKAQKKEKQEQILKIREKIEQTAKKKSLAKLEDLDSEIQDLDWKIQTTSLSIREEKELVSRVQALESQRVILKQLQKVNDTILDLQNEAKEFETQAKINHEKLSNLAEQSPKFHEQMMKTVIEINGLRQGADDAHQKYREFRQKAYKTHEKYLEVQQQIRLLREEAEKRKKEHFANREHELREEATKKAQEKMRQGQKLTWEEFKLLTEQEDTT